jgi:hypothetical protein
MPFALLFHEAGILPFITPGMFRDGFGTESPNMHVIDDF